MENKIEKLEKALKIKENNTNITNNTINNNTNNTINTNIIINNIGEENIKYLKSVDFANLLQGVYGAVPKLIEQIHFNPEYPENQNIKITNKKEPYIKVRKNNKWELQDKEKFLTDLLEDKYYILEDYYNELLDQNKEETINKEVMEKFMEKYNIEDEELLKTIKKKTEILILNNSKII